MNDQGLKEKKKKEEEEEGGCQAGAAVGFCNSYVRTLAPDPTSNGSNM